MSKYSLDLTKEFAGKRALITGGSRGIGAAVAQRLLDGGATVVVTARNTHAETPKGADFVAGDTRTLEGAQKVAQEALSKLGGLDILVNSAGAARVILPSSAAIPDEEWIDSLNINFLAALRVTYAVVPELLKTKGSIVNVTAGGPSPSAARWRTTALPRLRSATGRKPSLRSWRRKACASTS
jgi:NAD(P)-dependent dehydrogenase (short-subunit alcohol dehydrogenase family)